MHLVDKVDRADQRALARARYFIVLSSIVFLCVLFVGFALAPTLGLPISYDQSYQVVKQISPILIGYLGQCCYYIVKSTDKRDLFVKDRNLMLLMTCAPFFIFLLVFSALSWSYIVSNDVGAPPGIGMSFSRYTDWLTVLLGLFTATVSIITAWLFQSSSKADGA